MIASANWKCPVCHTMNMVMHDTDKPNDRLIEFCDTEIGGCGEMFVVETRRIVEVVAVMSTKVEYEK